MRHLWFTPKAPPLDGPQVSVSCFRLFKDKCAILTNSVVRSEKYGKAGSRKRRWTAVGIRRWVLKIWIVKSDSSLNRGSKVQQRNLSLRF